MLKEITQEQFEILLNNNTPIYNESIEIDGEAKTIQKVELREYAKYFEITDLEKSDLEKNVIITETLRILKEKGDIVMAQFVEKQKALVEKYGVEILQEIL